MPLSSQIYVITCNVPYGKQITHYKTKPSAPIFPYTKVLTAGSNLVQVKIILYLNLYRHRLLIGMGTFPLFRQTKYTPGP